MKGLVFKEFYLSRKNIILITFFWFLFVMVGILLRLSILYGNLAKLNNEDYADSELMLYFGFLYLPVVLIMSLNQVLLQNIYSDYSTKWTQFGYTLPVSEYRYVGSKFMVTGIISCTGFLLSLVNAAAMCILWDRKLDAELVLSLLSVVMFIIIAFVGNCAFAYRFKNPKTQGIIIFILMVIIMGGLFTGFGHLILKINKQYPNINDNQRAKIVSGYIGNLLNRAKELLFDIMPFLPLIFIVVMFLLYFLCVREMKRREH